MTADPLADAIAGALLDARQGNPRALFLAREAAEIAARVVRENAHLTAPGPTLPRAADLTALAPAERLAEVRRVLFSYAEVTAQLRRLRQDTVAELRGHGLTLERIGAPLGLPRQRIMAWARGKD